MHEASHAAAGEDAAIQDTIAKIADQVGKGRVGFLFGAGMSIPSGGLAGQTLAQQLVRKAFLAHIRDELPPALNDAVRDIVAKYPMEAIADGAWPNLPYRTEELEDFLKGAVFPQPPTINQGHLHLAQLAQRYNLRLLFTTNWDGLLEEALGTNAVPVTENSLHKLDRALASGDVAVVHLHGTFNDEPLICEKDLMDPTRPLFQVFLSEFLSKVFVFVGYSLSDPNIRVLYHRARQTLATRKRLEKNTYVVYPASNETESRVAAAVWKQRDMEYIPLTAEDFFRELHKQVMEIISVRLFDKVRKRLGIANQEDLRDNINRILAVFPGFGSDEQVLRYLDEITRGARQ